ncbi:probable serine/threonine-protein kinase PIX13 [Nymphaea colorata]|nr:probable serine/threonine-protein kinase PIX13 [Nymphaea colorata]
MGSCLVKAEKATQPSTSTSTTRPTSPGTTSTSRWSSSGAHFSSSTGDSLFSGGELPEGQILPMPTLKVFTFGELKTATRGFRPDTLLGEGGFGRVFKGWLDEKTLAPSRAGVGIVVAIKKLNKESMQGWQEWQSEINYLGRLSHANLVKLLGYCFDQNELLLVYEYVQKGSLENHLFRRSSALEPLSWETRLKILIGAARGLVFLHTSNRQIIYRDFKASNILLDANYNPKIADFGLAKDGPEGSDSHVTTRVIGTNGYAAPEYVATGHLYVKSDVYGFGVVLLEMMTGQRALDPNRPSGQHNLVEWTKPMLGDRRKVVSIMDPRLEGRFPSKAAVAAARLVMRCIESEPKHRPHMREVLETLESIEDIGNNDRQRVARSGEPRGEERSHRRRHHLHGQNPAGGHSPLPGRMDHGHRRLHAAPSPVRAR